MKRFLHLKPRLPTREERGNAFFFIQEYAAHGGLCISYTEGSPKCLEIRFLISQFCILCHCKNIILYFLYLFWLGLRLFELFGYLQRIIKVTIFDIWHFWQPIIPLGEMFLWSGQSKNKCHSRLKIGFGFFCFLVK